MNISREEIHRDHSQCHIYDNGCIMCDLVEDLHYLINEEDPNEKYVEVCINWCLSGIYEEMGFHNRSR